MEDRSRLQETAQVAVMAHVHDVVLETASVVRVDKYHNDELRAAGLAPHLRKVTARELIESGVAPYEVIERAGNLLMYGGASAFWDRLVDATPTVTVFDNTNAYLGVGNSATAAAATQTDLQGASKDRQGMEATYPQHTDGTGASSNADAVFKSSWGTGDGNFAWAEWGLFNASTAGRMLNRKVESLGTKTSAATWTLTVTLTLA